MLREIMYTQTQEEEIWRDGVGGVEDGGTDQQIGKRGGGSCV